MPAGVGAACLRAAHHRAPGADGHPVQRMPPAQASARVSLHAARRPLPKGSGGGPLPWTQVPLYVGSGSRMHDQGYRGLAPERAAEREQAARVAARAGSSSAACCRLSPASPAPLRGADRVACREGSCVRKDGRGASDARQRGRHPADNRGGAGAQRRHDLPHGPLGHLLRVLGGRGPKRVSTRSSTAVTRRRRPGGEGSAARWGLVTARSATHSRPHSLMPPGVRA